MNVLENTNLNSINWEKCYFAAISCYFKKRIFIFTIGEHLNHTCLMIFQQWVKMASCLYKFYVGRSRFTEMVGFMLFLKFPAETTIKICVNLSRDKNC